VEILKTLLDVEAIALDKLHVQVGRYHVPIKDPESAFYRDLDQLNSLRAIAIHQDLSNSDPFDWTADFTVSINLDWPQEIDEGEFLRRMKSMPKGKTFKFLS
jgi:hypothetical protein